MILTTVYTDHVFNQGYHISFDGLLRQKVVGPHHKNADN